MFLFLMMLPFLLLLYFVVIVIFNGLGLMTMAKNQGIDKAWLAWIPIGNFYIMGKICKDKFKALKITRLSLVYPIFMTVVLVIYFFFQYILKADISWFFTLFANTISSMVYYRIFRLYSPKNYVVMTVLNVLLGLGAFFVYAICNNTLEEYYTDEENSIE